MVDIHCHILPGVDDGAEDLEDALEMARLSAACGVTDLVATSHFRGDGSDSGMPERLFRRLRHLQDMLREEQIPLRLHPGAEILCTHGTIQLAQNGELPTISRTDYVLCEFFFDAPYEYMDEILDGIARAGYRPVIAHPERYEAIQRDPRRGQRWFHMGYVIQVNKGSILGAFGGRVQDAARWLLEEGFVHVIASDAHSPRYRTTDMSKLCRWLLEHYPEDYAQLLLAENPRRLLRGEDMAPVR